MSPYDSLTEGIVTEARDDDEILGLLLTGSIARGDAQPGADLDLRFIVKDGLSRPFRSEWQLGVHVERGYNNALMASQDIETKPMNVYAYLDGRILYDPLGTLAGLTGQARARFQTYRCPEPDRAHVAYWLGSAREKLTGAMVGGDLLKAAYVTATASWSIIEGLWAANDRPLPPNSSVPAHLGDLHVGPPDITQKYRNLFVADTRERVATAIELIEWILPRLSARTT